MIMIFQIEVQRGVQVGWIEPVGSARGSADRHDTHHT